MSAPPQRELQLGQMWVNFGDTFLMRKEAEKRNQPFFVTITFTVLICGGLFGSEKKDSLVSKRGLQREGFGIRKYFQPEWGPNQTWVFPLTDYLRLFLSLPCVFLSHIKTFRPRAMWIISQFSSWAVHQEQTQTSRPDQKKKKTSCFRQKTPTSGGFNAPTVLSVHFLCPELLCLPPLVS